MTYLDPEYWDVYVSSSALLSILGPIIENYDKETGGILLGSLGREWIEGENRPIIKIHSAFPSITAKSTKKKWVPKPAAFKRIQGFAKAYSLEILGEYHSHPDGVAELSDGDEEYIVERHAKKMAASKDYILFEYEEEDLEDDYLSWIELVVRVERKSYANKQKPSGKFWVTKNSNKLRGTIKPGNKYGYDVTLAAFAFMANPDEEGGYFRELGLFTEISSSYEK